MTETYYKFRMDLSKVLSTVIRVRETSELKVADLFEALFKVAPAVKQMEQKKVLRTVSTIYRKTLKYRGRKRE